jgi:hypothetical protein
MADGFIVRKGGAVTEQALAPTITEVSTTDSEIVFTITNNDASTAVILYEIGDATPDENSIELAADATSSNITVDTLDDDTEYTVSATASVTGKVLSNVTSLGITTDETIVYTAATGGTTEEYDSGGKRYKSHTFTSNGDFEVTTVGDATDDRNKVDYLIIAGGGTGGTNYGGGGGAGGYRTTFGTQGGLGTLDTKPTVTATTYSVTVGGAGANSTVAFPSSITSTAGGAGATALVDGNSGGSGGGAGFNISTSESMAVGTGTANQGFDGGLHGADGSDVNRGAGGGGGAGEVGKRGSVTGGVGRGGFGGDGISSVIRTGSGEFRAGGGGGAAGTLNTGGTGGNGGGGAGANDTDSSNTSSVAGTANTGGGGGGGSRFSGAGKAGGSGIVIIRYEIAPSV